MTTEAPIDMTYLKTMAPTTAFEMDIKLYENHANVKVAGIQKSISITDLKTILDRQFEAAEKLSTIALPPNCFVLSKSATKLVFNCYYPECKKEIKYKGYRSTAVQKFNVAFPNTILYVTMEKSGSNWKLQDLRYFCTNRRVTQLPKGIISKVDKANGILPMPFTNFYDNGNMCFGQNTLPETYPEDNLRGIEWLYQVIFSGIFNDDLGLRSLRNPYQTEAWYKKLEESATFPYEELRDFTPATLNVNPAAATAA